MSGPIFTQTSTPRERPKSLVEVISRIEQYAAVERHGTTIPANALQMKDRTLITWTGFKGGAGGMAIHLLLLPLSLCAFDVIVPVFGGVSEGPLVVWLDRVWAVVMSLSWSLLYLLAISLYLGRQYYGPAPTRMINWLYQGYLSGMLLKLLLGIIFYNWCHHHLTPTAVAGFYARWWQQLEVVVPRALLTALIDGYAHFYPLWSTVMTWLILTALVMVSIPPVVFRLSQRHLEREFAWRRLYDQC